jgi:hypothetical protein
MNWMAIWQISQMKQEELLKEAEEYRLSRVGKVKTKRSIKFLQTFMHNLGKILVGWGSSIQKRYGMNE